VAAELFDAVVVGSGFGGGVHALRLAEAGRSVLVLERGRRYEPADFPRDVRDVDTLFWRQPRPKARGLYELHFFSGLGVVTAAGVGGGSLVYANIHVRPDPAVFDDPRWPKDVRRPLLDPWYDRVAARLQPAPTPPDLRLPKRHVFREAARALRRDVFDPDEAVDWKLCERIAECEFGCRLGAKRTVDRTYLREAEQLGARLRTGALAHRVEPTLDGYNVHYEDLATGRRETATGRRVVLCAGTLGSNAILLRSRESGALARLSPRLGHGFSANGDFLGSIHHAARDLEPWNGPDVTSVMRCFDAAPGFTLAAPTFSRPVMEVLAALGQPSGRWLRALSPLWSGLDSLVPFLFERGALSRPRPLPFTTPSDPARVTNLFAIGRDNANGRVILRGGRLDVVWGWAAENRALVARVLRTMADLAAAYGGRFAPLVTWEAFRRIVTVHPLGGSALADSPEQGVTSPEGEVYGYPGLFVADGSVIPTSIGFHPAMTIAAVAERIAEHVVQSYPAGG
jgi:cholesterol oxidase